MKTEDLEHSPLIEVTPECLVRSEVNKLTPEALQQIVEAVLKALETR